MEIRWVEAAPASDIPERWKRLAALADDGTVYVPMAGVESWGGMFIVLRMIFENAPAIVHDEHIYVSAGWLAGVVHDPELAACCRTIMGRVRAYFNHVNRGDEKCDGGK
jgi:hypothetical protein